MRPRWKILIELVVFVTFFFLGAYMVYEALNGGPLWKWFGVLIVWFNGDRIVDRWSEL